METDNYYLNMKHKYIIIEHIYQFNKWYKFFIKTDIDFIEMMYLYEDGYNMRMNVSNSNYFQFELDTFNRYVRVLLSAFDLACSRITNKNHLYACYKYILKITCVICPWTNWIEDYSTNIMYNLCIYRCFNGIETLMQLSVINMNKMPNIFSSVCRERNTIMALEKLIKYIPNELLEKDMTYIIMNAILNIETLRWIFNQWPHKANLIDNNHIIKATSQPNIECLHLLFKLNPTVKVLDNVLFNPSYMNDLDMLYTLFNYRPNLKFSGCDTYFTIYAKNFYNQSNDLRLANLIIRKHPYKYFLKKQGGHLRFYARTEKEEEQFRIKYQLLHISNVKEKTNWLYRISDDVCRIIIHYV